MELVLKLYANGFFSYIIEKSSGNFALVALIAGILVCAVIGYFLGSLNFALILSGRMYNDDIRKHGSKNAGTTNMMRIYGNKAAGLTILGDMLKAVVAVVAGSFVSGHMIGGYAAALGCVIGHVFPVYYGFKGGKGVATAAAAILMLNYQTFFIVVGVFLVVVLFSRYISLGSVLAAAIFPLLTFYSYHNKNMVVFGGSFAFFCAFLMAVLVIAKHHENLLRLANGSESKFAFKKSKKTNDK